MERLSYITIGFVVAVVLIALFFGAKSVFEDVVLRRKKLNEIRMGEIARVECRNLISGISWYNICGFDKRVKDLIDSRLAERRGEHEGDSETTGQQQKKHPLP